MSTFITPYSGTAELTVSSGLSILDQGLWKLSQPGYNDGATFGVSLWYPRPLESGTLHLRAQNWTIAEIGNQLTSYDDGSTVWPASRCRIQVIGQWQIIRRPNSNSFNSQGIIYTGTTETDEGNRTMNPYLLNLATTPLVTYTIQGADVTGGAQNTFSSHVFYCRITESATSENSNKEFQSNSIARPAWAYAYTKSWQID